MPEFDILKILQYQNIVGTQIQKIQIKKHFYPQNEFYFKLRIGILSSTLIYYKFSTARPLRYFQK